MKSIKTLTQIDATTNTVGRLLNRSLALVGRNPYQSNEQGIIHTNSYFYQQKPGLISLQTLADLTGNQSESLVKQSFRLKQCNSLIFQATTLLRWCFAKTLGFKKQSNTNDVKLFGITLNNMNQNDVLNAFKNAIEKQQYVRAAFMNTDCFNRLKSNNDYRHALNDMTHIFADGSGVRLASQLLKQPLQANINGTDLLPHICQRAQHNSWRVFLYGAKPGVAVKMKHQLQKQFPELAITGVLNGYQQDEADVIETINNAKPHIVFVAKGAPIQEQWIQSNSHLLTAPVVFGVGGLFDFYSGNISRAPLWLRELGMEWIWRLKNEPKRMWRRYLIGNAQFLISVLTAKIRGKHHE